MALQYVSLGKAASVGHLPVPTHWQEMLEILLVTWALLRKGYGSGGVGRSAE